MPRRSVPPPDVPEPDPAAWDPSTWDVPEPPPDPPQDVTAPTDQPPYEWVCGDCEWRDPIWGRTMGEFSRALNHAYSKRRPDRHKIQGLYNRTTGELVIPFSTHAYQRQFHLGRHAPKPEEPAAAPDPPKSGGGAGGGGGSSGGGRRSTGNRGATDMPTRRLRVLAQDVEVSDVVTIALHLVARRLPELVPPELLANEATYAQALARFIEDAVVLMLDRLTQEFPTRFTPEEMMMALIAREAANRLTELEEVG
jgi:hypothetical protein